MICEAANERKADDIVIMEMMNRTSLCDFFIVISGTSTVRVKAIFDNIEETLKENGHPVLHKEGHQEGRWILMDYGSVIVHIFYHETRKFYDLEHLWGDAPQRHFVKS